MLLAMGRYQAVCPTTPMWDRSSASRIALESTSHDAVAGGSNVRSRNSIPISAIQAISSRTARSGWFIVPISIGRLLARDQNCERWEVGLQRDQIRLVSLAGQRADQAKDLTPGEARANRALARANRARNLREWDRAKRMRTTNPPTSLHLHPHG